MVAQSVDDLHNAKSNNLSKASSLSEKGDAINGRGDSPNRHDVLTGSNSKGVLEGAACLDSTSPAADGSVMVGHHDSPGGGADPSSWNAAHPSRGCGLANLRRTGGDGLYYSFATN
ncbi:MAG: hypothetical protein ABJL99_19795 [Aliishimia sp.]